jgi:hypothetical protein
MSTFSEWQAVYAERGIATVPCGLAKEPLVKRPEKFGCKASAEIVPKFPHAPALGYYAGRRNGITILDVYSTDESVLADALDRHGHTPVIFRSASGKFHAPYRHNGEARKIRAWDGLPIDLLGAGLCIAPPSRVAKGKYEVIQGHLDDLDRLPIMRGLDERLYANRLGPRPQMRAQMRVGDGRNGDFFKLLMQEAHHVDDYAQLLDRAETLNNQYGEPMEQVEVAKIAKSVWGYQSTGNNWVGVGRRIVTSHDEIEDLSQDAYYLLCILRQDHWGRDFVVANAMAETLGWHRIRLSNARRILGDTGKVPQRTG